MVCNLLLAMQRTVIHIVNALMGLLFAIGAVVQYNDPDPVLWVSAYGVGAIACGLFAVGRLPRWAGALLCGVYALWGLYLLIPVVVGANPFYDATGREMMGVMEEGREMMGLLIMAAWTGFLTWRLHLQEAIPSRKPADTTNV